MERKILLLLSHKCLQELYNIMYSKQDTRQVFKETAEMKNTECTFRVIFQWEMYYYALGLFLT